MKPISIVKQLIGEDDLEQEFQSHSIILAFRYGKVLGDECQDISIDFTKGILTVYTDEGEVEKIYAIKVTLLPIT